jgi:sporulation protein YlmC with PRC-barrel domain
MIEINIGTPIEHEGREIGRIEKIILDRSSLEASHLVVRLGKPLRSELLLMPLEWVTGSTAHSLRVDHAEAEFEALTPFELQHYVRLDEARDEFERTRTRIKPSDWVNYFVPFVANAFGDPLHAPGIVVTDRMLEPSESAIGRGLPVESSDGHRLGPVHEVLLSQPDWRLSGIIIERGFVRARPLRLPADWVAHVTEDRIVLNRTKEQVESWERTEST